MQAGDELAGFAAVAPKQLRDALLAAKAISEESDRLKPSTALVARVPGTLKANALLALIDAAGSASRKAAMSAAQVGAHLTFELGGQAGVSGLFRAIDEVCGWYP